PGEGFVDYYWIKSGESEASPKVSYVKSFEKWQWIVGSGIYIDDVEKEISEITSQIIIFLLLVLGIVAVLVLFFAKNLSTPLIGIVNSAQSISSGNFATKIEELNRNDEIGILQKAFSETVKIITDKVFWYEQLLDAMPFPISVTDMDMNWTFINKPVAGIIGKTREEVVGKKMQCNNWNADICNTKNCGVELLRNGTHNSQFTQPGLDKDFSVVSEFILDKKGEKIGHIEIVQDITDANRMKIRLEDGANTLLEEMNKFSSGDLTVALVDDGTDAIAQLYLGFTTAVARIRDIIQNVAEASQATASASTQISSSAEEMAAGAQEQSSQTSEVAAAMEEMSRTIVETASNATIAAEASKESSVQASAGVSKVNESKKGMENIVESAQVTGKIISSLANRTDQIGEIAQVIDDIADQTNLLALNAAIEAARAGEQGRGFAVVADEVRKLAERTTKATKEIAETIKAIQVEAKEANNSMKEAGEAVNSGLKLNDEVGEVLEAILAGAENVATQINQVAAASEEQSATAEEVSTNVEAINNVANESAAGVQQIASASEDLNKLTENLSELVEQFKMDNSNNNNKLLGA
ncbi:MAG: methyl-accepting chemotaxis protein, partial [Melioribacteraceae bacterium]|nr:methyl-accepting chemotaxis protein [Melioribacteraceae bacterium]